MVRPCSRAACSECTEDRSTPCQGNSPGIDIGKNSFHIVGQNQRGAIALRQKWSRGQVQARLAPAKVGAAKSPTGSRRSESADFFEGHSEEIDHLARQPFHPGASLLKNSNSASGPMTQRFIIRRHLDWIGNPIKNLRRSPSIEHSTKHRKDARASK